MKLICALGNIGDDYINTRHNVGFMVLDDYLEQKTGSVEYSLNKNLHAFVAVQNQVVFIKPTTFMNQSGNAVIKTLQYYKINVTDLLVIQDDIDQQIGSFKYVVSGGAGGHKGITSIQNMLRENDIKRIKIGIAPKIYNPQTHKAEDFVLKKFNLEEKMVLKENYPEIFRLIDGFVSSQ